MKNMKLIMENFRKSMKEGWPGEEKPSVPWAGKPQKNWDSEIARRKASEEHSKQEELKKDLQTSVAATVRDEIISSFDNKHSNVADIVDDPNTKLDTGILKAHIKRHWGDAIASATGVVNAELKEKDYNAIINLMDTFGDEEEETERSDLEDRVGYMPGDGADWK